MFTVNEEMKANAEKQYRSCLVLGKFTICFKTKQCQPKYTKQSVVHLCKLKHVPTFYKVMASHTRPSYDIEHTSPLPQNIERH